MGNCCAKPLFKIIKIGGVDVGIKGLDQAFEEVHSTNEKDSNKVKDLLLAKIKDYGNYVSPKREGVYKDDLLNEFNKFCISLQLANGDHQDIKEPEQKQGRFSFRKGKK